MEASEQRLVEEVEQAVASYRSKGWPPPKVLLVSGSGLAVDMGDDAPLEAPLSEFLPFEIHGVEGHPHQLELVHVEGPEGKTPILYQRGRLHSYQGYDANRTVLMVRMAALLGAHTLVMSNAAGGLHAEQRPGDLVLIRDHLNLSGLNPLRGELPEAWGPRFVDMVGAYDETLRAVARERAAEQGLELPEGVYAGFAGPTFETPAEVVMARAMGADLVGMSTVLEVITARHMGLRCLCFSLVSNLAAGVTDEPVKHEEVLETGRRAAGRIQGLLGAILRDPRLVEG